MKKLLSTLLAFVMILTAVFTVDLSAFAKAFTDADIKENVSVGATPYVDENVVITEEGGYLLYMVTADEAGYYTFKKTNVAGGSSVDAYGYLLSPDNLNTDEAIVYNNDARNDCTINYYLNAGEQICFAVRYYNSTDVDKPFNVNIGKVEGKVINDVVYEKTTETIAGVSTDVYHVTGYVLPSLSDAVIESEIDGIPVTEISSMAFVGCYTIKSVVIPGSVKLIDYYAFYNCAKLESVVFNEGLEKIKSDAFNNTKIESIHLPSTVSSVNVYAFHRSSKLSAITVAEENAYYKAIDNVLYTKDGTKLVLSAPAKTGSLTVPDGVTSIGEMAVAYSQLSSVTLPDSVETIGAYAFIDCSNLENIDLGQGLKTIWERAFSSDMKLISIELPDTLVTIGNGAFRYSGIYSVNIPSSVTKIYTNAFSGCDNLQAAVINNAETVIDSNAFSNSTTKLCGHDSSTAKTYAEANSMEFVSIDLGVGEECSHLYYNDKVVSAPTCQAEGVMSTKCAICGQAGENTAIPKLNHYYSSIGICKDCGQRSENRADIALNQSTDYTITQTNKWIRVIYPVENDGQYNVTLSNIDPNIEYYCFDTVDEDLTYGPYIENTIGATFNLTKGSYISIYVEGPVDSTFTAKVECCHSILTEIPAVAATCTKAGNTSGVKCSACNEIITAPTAVAAKGHSYKTYTTKATTSKNGSVVTKCTACGAVKSTQTIARVSSVKLSTTSYTYNGKVKTPSVTVKDSKGKTLKKNTDYTVSYAKGRKYVGKYAVKITFKGNYSGTKTLYFYIKPKTTSISSLTAGSKKFTVKWKKQATQTTGYQIQYSTSSKFTNAKTVTISKNGTTSKTISKLSGKKKYYVRVRTYKVVKINGKATKIYSGWSKAKYVTTKK
ncbi:MAG: leucine-rich repeat protein [Eubacterium sp.]